MFKLIFSFIILLLVSCSLKNEQIKTSNYNNLNCSELEKKQRLYKSQIELLDNNNVNKSKIDNLKYLCFSIVGCFVDGILITGPDIKKYKEKEKKLNELTVILSSLKKLRKKKNCIKN